MRIYIKSHFTLLLVCVIVFPLFTSCAVGVQVPLGPYNPHLNKLVTIAQENGEIRLRIDWKMDDFQSERRLSPEEVADQRQRVGHIQEHGIQLIEEKELNVQIVQNHPTEPRTTLIADDIAVLHLYRLEVVERIDQVSKRGRNINF